MVGTRPADVRPAAGEDLADVRRLRAAALAELRPLRGGDLYPAADLPAGDDGDHRLWVGSLAGEVVGYLSARVDERRVGVVSGIYVDPECRAVGIGEAMMEAALAWFRSAGCVGVDALALPGARATKNFFEETGFTARLLVMHHRF